MQLLLWSWNSVDERVALFAVHGDVDTSDLVFVLHTEADGLLDEQPEQPGIVNANARTTPAPTACLPSWVTPPAIQQSGDAGRGELGGEQADRVEGRDLRAGQGGLKRQICEAQTESDCFSSDSRGR